jgi:RNA polymerase sigma factor (sigma-70 family)
VSMRRSRRRQINKEIASVASLRQSAIDLSDVPELKDWSQAVVGRFHRPRTAGVLHVESRVPAGNQHPQPTAKRFREMKNDLLVQECVGGADGAWIEFIRRSQGIIAESIGRLLRRSQVPSPGLVDDLVQDVYLKLFANQWDLLKRLGSHTDQAFGGFLQIVATNVAQDYLRSGVAAKREAVTYVADRPTDVTERAALLSEIDRILSRIASRRDEEIFWLYYGQGFTAGEIAGEQEELTIKGVESVLSRLRQAIAQELVRVPRGQVQAAAGHGPVKPALIQRGERRNLKQKSVDVSLLAIKQLIRTAQEQSREVVRPEPTSRANAGLGPGALDALLRDIGREH